MVHVSAKEGTGINKLFEDLAARLLDSNPTVESSVLYEGNPKIEFRTNNKRCNC